jgi:hypothetical protein
MKEQKSGNYMFFGNLQQMKRQCDLLCEIDENEINQILENGHDWADDHVSVAKENLDQVFDFIMNETNKTGQDIKINFSPDNNEIFVPSLMNEGVDLSDGLKYHIQSKRPITSSVFKKDSLSYNQLIWESYELYLNGDIDLPKEDVELFESLEYGPVEETDLIADDILNEAEYQGRKVQLGKIMQGDIKKFKVFVKNDKGKVVKVNFGFGGKSAKGKRMVIKKNNPERRKSFRARHNCDNPGPRWKARYWACRTW